MVLFWTAVGGDPITKHYFNMAGSVKMNICDLGVVLYSLTSTYGSHVDGAKQLVETE